MDRRRYLRSLAATAGVVTAGCARTESRSVSGLSVVGVDGTPLSAMPATVAVEAAFTAGHPAELRVTLTNEADRERTIRLLMGLPFPPYDGRRVDGDGRIETVPQTEDYPDVVPRGPTGGCWEATRPAGGEDYAPPRTLGPGETLAQRYTLLSAARSEGCLPAGRYRFETDDYAGTGEPWGFTLRIGPDGD